MAIIKSNKSWFRQAHGGKIKVETKVEDESTFIIQLPLM
jgi:signal transduction histidine kinase